MSSILDYALAYARFGLPVSPLHSANAQVLWTRPVSLGARAVGWPASEIAALYAARISGKSESEIRALVIELEAARKSADSR
jgi:prophage regulatory protein